MAYFFAGFSISSGFFGLMLTRDLGAVLKAPLWGLFLGWPWLVGGVVGLLIYALKDNK